MHHGRINYIRNSEIIIYFFYKNFVAVVPSVIFAYYSGFSAFMIYDDFFMTLYNTLFTCSALFNKACLEWDINPDTDGKDLESTLPLIYFVG